MAKKYTRRVTADDGTQIELIVREDSEDNTVTITDPDGTQKVIPLSARAVRNTADWLADIA